MRQAAKIFLTSLLLILNSSSLVSGKVVINEVLPNPLDKEVGAEWVELYNLEDSPIPLSNCTLYLHATDNYQNVVFEEDDFIDKFKVISWNNSWLRNDGDQVRLACTDYTDSVAYGDAETAVVDAPDKDITFGRNPDGTGSFYILSEETLGKPNSPPPTPTPTPTLKPANTPKPAPTDKPTPKPTVKPTNPPAGGPTVKAALTARPTNTSSSENSENGETADIVLGTRDKLTPTPKDEKAESEKTKFPLAAGLFVLGGLSFIGAAAYPMIKSRKKGYTKKSVGEVNELS